MPKIPLYEQQVSATGGIPSRQAQGDDFGGPGLIEVGRATQSLGQYLGYAQRQLNFAASQKAVTDVHTALSMLRSEYTKKAYDAEAKADPADTKLGDRFLFGQSGEADEGSLKWALDTYREQIQDPAALATFDRGASDLTERFTLHFAQVQAKMAGVHAKQQAARMIDAAQGTLQTDPSQYTEVLASTLRAIDDPNGVYARISAEQREPIKRAVHEQLASSTVRGMIRDSPQHALHSLEIGEWDRVLKGEDKVTLMSEAETRIKANQVEADAAMRREKRAREETASTLAGHFTIGMAKHLEDSKNPMPSLLTPEMQQLNTLDDKLYQSLLSMKHAWVGSDATAHAKTDLATYWDLYKKIYLPYGHPDKLTSADQIIEAATTGRKLSPTDTDRLTRHFMDARTDVGMKLGKQVTDFLESWKPMIDNTMAGANDPLGRMKFGQYQQRVWEEVERAKSQNRDPSELFKEGSKYYLGGDTALAYRPTMRDVIQYKTNMVKSPSTNSSISVPLPAVPRQEGESPAAYLKRKREGSK